MPVDTDTIESSQYVSVCVLLFRDDRILMLYREHARHMNKHYTLPAGRVKAGETIRDGAIRELHEETGLNVSPDDLELVILAQRHSPDLDRYVVDAYFVCTQWEGEPQNIETHLNGRIEWLDIHNLPDNVIPYEHAAINAYLRGERYTEVDIN